MSKAQRGLIAVVVVGVAVALVVVLSGGGSDERSRRTPTAPAPAPRAAEDYKRGALRASRRFEHSAAAAAKRVRAAGSVAGRLAALDALEAVIVRAADDFSGLSPPPQLASDNRALVSALRTLAGLVERRKQVVRSGDAAAARELSKRVSGAQAELQAAISRLESEIGP
jgi:hypothetical protein